jgi:fatty acid desaturase
MSNFRHRATDSLRDKLQTLPIFMFILYQMDKLSGICVVSPNTKALALHSRVVLALNSYFFSLFFYFCCRAECICVVLDFWMHSIYKCTSKVLGIFVQKWRLIMGLCFVYVCVREHLFPPYLFTIDTTRSAPIRAMCSTSSDIAR